jgi:hypothetical protein
VNTTSEITEQQIVKLDEVLRKYEKLFAEKLGLAKKSKDD